MTTQKTDPRVQSSHEQDLKVVVKGAGTYILGESAAKGLHFLFNVVAAWFLGSSALGLFFLAWAVVSLVEELSTLGLKAGVIRYTALYAGQNSHERIKGTIISAYLVTILSSIIVAATLVFASEFIAGPIFNKPALTVPLRILALTIPFSALTLISIGVTQGFKEMKYTVLIHAFQPLTGLVISLVLFFLGFRLLGMVVAYASALVIGAALAFYFATKVFPIFTSEYAARFSTGQLLKFSIFRSTAGVAAAITMWTGTFILGYYGTSADVGIFNIIMRFIMIGTVFLAAFRPIFAPFVSDLSHKNEIDRLETLYKTVTKWVFALSFPLFVLFMFFSTEILTPFGEDFAIGSLALIIASFGGIVQNATGPCGVVILMTGRSYITLINQAGLAILNITLNVLLVPSYGIVGAAMAGALSILAINSVSVVWVYYFLRIQPYSASYVKPLVAAALGITAVLLIERFVHPTGYELPYLAALIVIFVVLYGLLLILFGLDKQDRYVIDLVRKKLAITPQLP